MHAIKAWLSNRNRDYLTGIRLYEQYGKYKSVVAECRKRDNEHNREMLLRCMRMTWDELEPKIEKKMAELNQVPAPEPAAATTAPPAQDEKLKKIDDKWKPLYAEMAMHHSRLLMCADNEQRYQVACRVMELQKQCIAIWKQRDTYLKTGKMPVKRKRKALKIKELTGSQHLELVRIRVYVSRAIRHDIPDLEERYRIAPTIKIKQALDNKRAALAKWQTRINELENGK